MEEQRRDLSRWRKGPYARAHDRFRFAVWALALGEGRIQERLGDAWRHLIAPFPDGLPEGVYRRLGELHVRWGPEAATDRGATVVAVARTLTDAEAVAEARWLVGMDSVLGGIVVRESYG